jgi:hypothetical protein
MVTLGALCVAFRFAARWFMQNSSVGWDDWTILLAYLLLIPSTALVQISSSAYKTLAGTTILTFRR